MAKSPINFAGAAFDVIGRSCTVLANGTRVNEKLNRRITLADKTEFHSHRCGWSRRVINDDAKSFYGSSSHVRKCNERYSILLEQAWEANFKVPTNEQ